MSTSTKTHIQPHFLSLLVSLPRLQRISNCHVPLDNANTNLEIPCIFIAKLDGAERKSLSNFMKPVLFADWMKLKTLR